MTNKTRCMHIFKRDYRLTDNTSLIQASKEYDEIIPIFIFTYNQIRDNPYKSNICIKFLVESLTDLDKHLKKLGSRLHIYYGNEHHILKNIFSNNLDEIHAISFNNDYTPYAISRNNDIINLANQYNIKTIINDDICLFKQGTITTTNGKAYTKFTPFYNKCLSLNPRTPNKYKVNNFTSSRYIIKGHNEYTAPLASFYDENKIKHIKTPNKGGRTHALKILKALKNGKWNDYDDNRDFLMYETTQLSAYNKFGCLSIREIYYTVKKYLGINSSIIRQLIWRDFYYNLGEGNPHIFKGAMNEKFNNIKWNDNPTGWDAWIRGRTGYPIVDACMMQIKNTGFMHNRGRLIVSNFLSRILHINWQKGEKWFANNLYDYDPIQNNFGWQVNAAVSGTESRPLTQTILNPWIQSSKYDNDAEYIKRWIPGLKDVKPEHLHRWDLHYHKYNLSELNYVKPIVDYSIEKQKNIEMYRKYI